MVTVTAKFTTTEPRVMGVYFKVQGVKVVEVKMYNGEDKVVNSMVSKVKQTITALIHFCL